MIDRRALIAAAALSGLAPRIASAKVDGARAFDFIDLVALARSLRDKPHAAPASRAKDVLDRIDYVEHGDIRHAPEKAEYPGTEFPVTYFPLGQLFRKPVRIFRLVDGLAGEVAYDPALFDAPAGSPLNDLPDDAGFAGFRIHDKGADGKTWGDWAAFLGASYFRSSGDDRQYGASARGIAVNTEADADGEREEFPDFTRLYVSPAKDGAIQVLALLEGPSLTGAYRFAIRKEPKVTFQVGARLFLRRDVRRLGIAPATSMYSHSETLRWTGPDWRPEIHDSDGLLIETAGGERLWRPLNNPPRVMVSAFGETSPRGFGLMQRDRAYGSYRDPVRYDRRPHLWVETQGEWGRGSVQLVEIPTRTEYEDNVVAFWVPAEPAKAGQDLKFDYALHFAKEEPKGFWLARCVATRLSKMADTPVEDRTDGVEPTHRDFVVEFSGGELHKDGASLVTPVASASRGHVTRLDAAPEPDGSETLRVFFRIHARGEEPVELRLVLEKDGKPASETWLFQYHPEHWS